MNKIVKNKSDAGSFRILTMLTIQGLATLRTDIPDSCLYLCWSWAFILKSIFTFLLLIATSKGHCDLRLCFPDSHSS